MSIQETRKAIKSPEATQERSLESDIFEEEFDIVPKGKVSQGEQSSLKRKEVVFAVILICTASILSFFIGRLSVKEEEVKARIYGGIPVTEGSSENKERSVQQKEVSASGEVQGALDGEVVASKSGTKYHYPWCAGAKQIAEKNKIIFPSIEKAKEAGYAPASNCKGLK